MTPLSDRRAPTSSRILASPSSLSRGKGHDCTPRPFPCSITFIHLCVPQDLRILFSSRCIASSLIQLTRSYPIITGFSVYVHCREKNEDSMYYRAPRLTADDNIQHGEAPDSHTTTRDRRDTYRVHPINTTLRVHATTAASTCWEHLHPLTVTRRQYPLHFNFLAGRYPVPHTR